MTIDLDELANDALVEVIIEAIPDMSTTELAQLEIAINGELQDRARTDMNLYFNGDVFRGG